MLFFKCFEYKDNFKCPKMNDWICLPLFLTLLQYKNFICCCICTSRELLPGTRFIYKFLSLKWCQYCAWILVVPQNTSRLPVMLSMKNYFCFSGTRNAQQFPHHNNPTKFTSAEASKKNEPVATKAMNYFSFSFVMGSTSISQGIHKVLLINAY